jgi:D-arabinose 5-phosphate isomerase GutQ/beta-phosphoglucomutase-like phosphatase (HAD superfamily)
MSILLEYDLFIFDFDGTLIDTEKYHCIAWNKALKDHSISNNNNNFIELNLKNYLKYFHTLDNNNQKVLLKLMYDINNYDDVYNLKQKYYNELIKTENINFINGAENFLNYLIKNNKKFIIVSNTSEKFIEIFKKKYLILNKALKIYTKEYFLNKKPNPECYLKILNEYKYEKKIGFEDSLIGFHALYQVSDIVPVLIYNSDYYYTNHIFDNYKNFIISNNYDIVKLNESIYYYNNIQNLDSINNKLFISNLLNHNIQEQINSLENMKYIIESISIILSNINPNNNIYLTGMGKSGYICKKSASTWQSLSIKSSYIDLPNLPHGDFGIFRDNDILLLISNGGNTSEIIYILKYIKETLKKNINIISIVANKNSEMEKYSNFTFILDNIKEADLINMTPSTSSIIFMSLLDAIGINIKKMITKDEFKLYHPCGSLGKR